MVSHAHEVPQWNNPLIYRHLFYNASLWETTFLGHLHHVTDAIVVFTQSGHCAQLASKQGALYLSRCYHTNTTFLCRIKFSIFHHCTFKLNQYTAYVHLKCKNSTTRSIYCTTQRQIKRLPWKLRWSKSQQALIRQLNQQKPDGQSQ